MNAITQVYHFFIDGDFSWSIWIQSGTSISYHFRLNLKIVIAIAELVSYMIVINVTGSTFHANCCCVDSKWKQNSCVSTIIGQAPNHFAVREKSRWNRKWTGAYHKFIKKTLANGLLDIIYRLLVTVPWLDPWLDYNRLLANVVNFKREKIWHLFADGRRNPYVISVTIGIHHRIHSHSHLQYDTNAKL